MITRVEVEKERAALLGLEPLKLERLGNVVVLAGPNGGGKSRILRLVREVVAESLAAQVQRPMKAMEVGIHVTTELAGGAVDAPRFETAKQELAAVDFAISRIHWDGPTGQAWALDERRSGAGRLNSSSREIPPIADVEGRRDDLLRRAAKALFLGEHPRVKDSAGMQQTYEAARKLGLTVSQALGTQFDFRLQGVEPVPTVFGLDPGVLSAGQKRLLDWALWLAERDATLSDSVLLLDEPERNLHPEMTIESVERLRVAVGTKGQLWIATHCPALVAHLARESVYVVAANRAEYVGSKVNHVMDGLLGGSGQTRAFAEFLLDAERLALTRFAVEAVFPAGIAEHREEDPQERQFVSVVADRVLRTTGRKLRLLDYAAGKGRFAGALAEQSEGVRTRLDYWAFNDPKYDEHHKECVDAVERIHPGEGESRVVNKLSDFWEPEDRVDLVVMSNFLHEVEPIEWKTHLDAAAAVLREDGALIVIEDQTPSVGEFPTRTGFVILDIDGLRALFELGKQVRPLARDDARLTAFEIPQAVLSRCSSSGLRRALEKSRDRARAAIRALRQDQVARPHDRGRALAMNALLFASASMALDQLGHS